MPRSVLPEPFLAANAVARWGFRPDAGVAGLGGGCCGRRGTHGQLSCSHRREPCVKCPAAGRCRRAAPLAGDDASVSRGQRDTQQRPALPGTDRLHEPPAGATCSASGAGTSVNAADTTMAWNRARPGRPRLPSPTTTCAFPIPTLARFPRARRATSAQRSTLHTSPARMASSAVGNPNPFRSRAPARSDATPAPRPSSRSATAAWSPNRAGSAAAGPQRPARATPWARTPRAGSPGTRPAPDHRGYPPPGELRPAPPSRRRHPCTPPRAKQPGPRMDATRDPSGRSINRSRWGCRSVPGGSARGPV